MNIRMEFDLVQNILNEKLYDKVFSFSVKDKRSVFLNTRSFPDVSHDSFLVFYGITVGEFCFSCITSDYIKREKKHEIQRSLRASNGWDMRAETALGAAFCGLVGGAGGGCVGGGGRTLDRLLSAMETFFSGFIDSILDLIEGL